MNLYFRSSRSTGLARLPISVSELLFICIIISVVMSLFMGCAANSGVQAQQSLQKAGGAIAGAAAGVLSSPITQGISSVLADAFVDSLIQSGTKNWSPAEQQVTLLAANTAATNLSSDFLYSAATALRSLQGTSNAANGAAISTAVANAGAIPIAPTLASAVPAIANVLPASNVGPGNAANEAAAMMLEAAARSKATAFQKVGGKTFAMTNRIHRRASVSLALATNKTLSLKPGFWLKIDADPKLQDHALPSFRVTLPELRDESFALPEITEPAELARPPMIVKRD